MTNMVTAEVSSVLWWGEGEPDEDPRPLDQTHFGFRAQVFIGERGGEGADSFDVLVCSPSWLAEEMAADRWQQFAGAALTDMTDAVIPGAGIWLMRRWSKADFETAVRQLCEICSPGPDWGSVASRIGRLLPWEYDYRYDAHVDEHYGEAFPPKRRPA